MANSIIDPRDPDYCPTCSGECIADCQPDDDAPGKTGPDWLGQDPGPDDPEPTDEEN